MKVGDTHYSAIEGLPSCAHEGCSKKVTRVGGIVEAAYCRFHYREALDRLMDDGVPLLQYTERYVARDFLVLLGR